MWQAGPPFEGARPARCRAAARGPAITEGRSASSSSLRSSSATLTEGIRSTPRIAPARLLRINSSALLAPSNRCCTVLLRAAPSLLRMLVPRADHHDAEAVPPGQVQQPRRRHRVGAHRVHAACLHASEGRRNVHLRECGTMFGPTAAPSTELTAFSYTCSCCLTRPTVPAKHMMRKIMRARRRQDEFFQGEPLHGSMPYAHRDGTRHGNTE